LIWGIIFSRNDFHRCNALEMSLDPLGDSLRLKSPAKVSTPIVDAGWVSPSFSAIRFSSSSFVKVQYLNANLSQLPLARLAAISRFDSSNSLAYLEAVSTVSSGTSKNLAP
jgi:hypothetical protein